MVSAAGDGAEGSSGATVVSRGDVAGDGGNFDPVAVSLSHEV